MKSLTVYNMPLHVYHKLARSLNGSNCMVRFWKFSLERKYDTQQKKFEIFASLTINKRWSKLCFFNIV